jgi:DNA repair photolyase
MPAYKENDAVRGRGTGWNPANRFESSDYALDESIEEAPDTSRPDTVLIADTSRSILSHNDSPDVNFDTSINPYRGCEHGCIYCYARPTHEYLGLSAGLDFETRIHVKYKAAALLRDELGKKSYTPQPIGISGVTDPYQPIERDLGLTRQCLEVLNECRNPVSIITKNRLVTRDVDILADMAAWGGASVWISVTTLDLKLNRILEPRSSAPAQRLEAIRTLSAAGIPVGLLVAPVIPAITESEMPAIMQAAADAGATRASYIMLRLPLAVAPLFERWLDQHYPDRKEKVLNRVRSLRGGKLYDSRFGDRMKGAGAFAAQSRQLFEVAARRNGFNRTPATLETRHFRRPGNAQLELF